jgi:hypothetical protein
MSQKDPEFAADVVVTCMADLLSDGELVFVGLNLELLVEELGDSPELLSGGQQLNALTLPTALLGAKEGRPHTLSHAFEDRLGFFPL